MLSNSALFKGENVAITPETVVESAKKAAPAPALEAAADEAEVVRRILRALAGLEFGSVEIIVQNSKVVQIERTQRSRFAQPLDIPRS